MPLTRLIGREPEVATLRAGLQDDDVRFLTLTGPGGVGKTRLAIEVVGALHDTFPDGVVFVDLSPLTAADLVVPTIAAALGVRESAERHLIDTLAPFLAPKRLLLVLDNCEQVLEAAPVIITLLAAGPGVTVFATSRAPFHVRGEQAVPLLPLPLPAADRVLAVEEVAQFPAITLFVERARAVQPGFRAHHRQRQRRRRDLPPARWAAAGHRAGGGADQGASRRRHCSPGSSSDCRC